MTDGIPGATTTVNGVTHPNYAFNPPSAFLNGWNFQTQGNPPGVPVFNVLNYAPPGTVVSGAINWQPFIQAAVNAANAVDAEYKQAVSGVCELHGITLGPQDQFTHASAKGCLTVVPAPVPDGATSAP